MTGFEQEAFRKFDQQIFTIADYFQVAGYETFRYGDADLSRAVPMSGFKRWESSGYKIGRILKNTKLTRTKSRDDFIEEVNACKKNKFVYHHMLLQHELCGDSCGSFWPSEVYAANVEITAKEFQKLYYEYDIGENDLVIISSDHGVMLDVDYIKESKIKEQRQYEQSIWAFCSFVGKGIHSQILDHTISSLDEMPTLLHLVFGGNVPFTGQGMDQYDYINNGIYHSNICYRESNRWGSPELNNSGESTLFCLRDGKWKYLYGSENPACEWLMDMERNKDYEVNLKDQYPELTKKYQKMLKEKIEESKSFQYRPVLGITKKELPKMFSLILQNECPEEETIESLLDMSGPYYEIVVLESEKTKKYQNQYKMRYVQTLDDDTLRSVCQGEWIVYITDNGGWAEYFLSDLYHYIKCHRNRNVQIIGKHYTAIRKEDMVQSALPKLYEENQVRDIRYLHKIDTDKKYIIFGCGVIGKEAIGYFGEKNVACFADNNMDMVGKKVCGKTVISFTKMKEIYSDYMLVIATKARFAKEIMRQFDKQGIYDYLWLKEYEKRNLGFCWESGYQVLDRSQIDEMMNDLHLSDEK